MLEVSWMCHCSLFRSLLPETPQSTRTHPPNRSEGKGLRGVCLWPEGRMRRHLTSNTFTPKAILLLHENLLKSVCTFTPTEPEKGSFSGTVKAWDLRENSVVAAAPLVGPAASSRWWSLSWPFDVHSQDSFCLLNIYLIQFGQSNFRSNKWLL